MAELFALGGSVFGGGGGGLMSGLSLVTGLAGTLMQANAANTAAKAAIAQGQAAKQAAEFEAAGLDIRAKEEQAAAQREAEQLSRKRQLALSTLTNRAAGSGFSATDPTSLQIGDEISRYGTLQSGMAEYGGQSRRAGVEGQATARRMEGAAAERGAAYAAAGHRTSGMASIFSGISTLAGRFSDRPQQPAYGYSYRYG